ncbi:MAG: L-seryl-tRNA(Sec) selenium transferase [Planctomycetes bacterium]|nr:L-seryl-tRNA(Sec) selenium transferase [Planctomycetota bacterium]
MDDPATILRRIPKIDVLLGQIQSAGELAEFPRPLVAEAVRATVTRFRNALVAGAPLGEAEAFFSGRGYLEHVLAALAALLGRRHVPVINATGILLHTGLGRAPLADAAIDAAAAAARYSVLEVDPESGERDQREVRVAELLRDLTGAGAATVVNNNAAAVLLALTALAAGREVLVARGEMVEIGGGFRMPDVMQACGCRLKEVGTTNRTYVQDYARAIGPDTGLILRVHTSNFRLVGFTHAAAGEELAALAGERRLPLMYDLGSGLLRPVDVAPLQDEPAVVDAVRAGYDLVTFSGDKLLCGPQAGLVVGRAEHVNRMRAHPLFRALRPDKLCLAALEATLLAYRRAPEGLPDLPLYQALGRGQDELFAWASRLAAGLSRIAGVAAEAQDTVGFLGSGSAPAREIPGVAVAVRRAGSGPLELAERLRRGTPRVFARVDEDALVLDLRAVFADELEPLFDAVVAALSVKD